MRDSKLVGVLIAISSAPIALASTVHINSQDWVDIGNMDKYKPIPVSGTLPATTKPAVAKKDEKKPALSAVKQGEIYNFKKDEAKSQSDNAKAAAKDKKSETAKGGAEDKAMDKRSILSNTEGLLEKGASLTKVKTNADYLSVSQPITPLSERGARLDGRALQPGERVQIPTPLGVVTGTVLPTNQTVGLARTATAYTDAGIPFTSIRGGTTANMVGIAFDPLAGGRFPMLARFMPPGRGGSINYYAPTDDQQRGFMNEFGRRTGVANGVFCINPANGTISMCAGGGGGPSGGSGRSGRPGEGA